MTPTSRLIPLLPLLLSAAFLAHCDGDKADEPAGAAGSGGDAAGQAGSGGQAGSAGQGGSGGPGGAGQAGAGQGGGGQSGAGQAGEGGAPGCKPAEAPPSQLGKGTYDPTTPGQGPCAGKTLGDVISAMKAAYPDTAPYGLSEAPSWDDPQYRIEAGVRADGFRLVLIKGWGDCPSGCVSHAYRYFETDGACAAVEKGSFEPVYDNTKQCNAAKGKPMWNVPPTCNLQLCDTPPIASGVFPIHFSGDVLSCTPPEGGQKPAKVQGCGELSLVVDPNDPKKGSVTVAGTGLSQLEGKTFPVVVNPSYIYATTQGQPPGQCLEQHDVTLTFSPCSNSGSIELFDVSGSPPDCTSITCKGGGMITLSPRAP